MLLKTSEEISILILIKVWTFFPKRVDVLKLNNRGSDLLRVK